MKIDNLHVQHLLFFLTLLFLPTQLGKHFWPEFSIVSGLRVDYLSPTIYLTDTLILLLFVLWVINRVSTKKEKFSISHLSSAIYFQFKQFVNDSINGRWKMDNGKLIGVFTIFIIVGILLSKSPMSGLYGFLKLLEMTFLGIFISRIDLKKYLGRIIIMLIIGVVFESFLAILQFYNQGSVGTIFWFFGERTFSGLTPGIANATINGELFLRAYGTLPHPNVLGGFLIITMTIISSSYKTMTSKLVKTLILASFIFGTFALFLTMSRVATAFWIIVLGTIFLSRLREILLKNRLLFFVPVLVIWLFFSLPVGSRFLTFDFSSEEFTRRIELTNASFKMIYENPVFGVGLNNFLVNLSNYQKTESLILYLQPVHNIYLLIATETGIVGLIFFLWLIAKTYKRIMNQESGIRQKKFILHNSYFIILSIVLVLGLFDHYFLTLQQGQLLTAIVFGLCWNNTRNFHDTINL